MFVKLATRAEFHQCSTYSFHMSGAQKRKKDSQIVSLFTLLGSTSLKAERKYVGEIGNKESSLPNFLITRFLILRPYSHTIFLHTILR